MLLFQFAAAVLAAFGIDHPAETWSRRAQWSLVVFGALTLTACFAVMIPNRLNFPGDEHVILTGVIALLLAALLYAHRNRSVAPGTVNVLLVMLLLLELGTVAAHGLVPRDDSGQMHWLNRIYSNADVAKLLREQSGFPRVEVEHEDFAPNWGDWHKVEMYGGKGASVPLNVLDSELFSKAGHRLWGVAYILAPEPKPDAPPALFTSSSGMKVYRRDDAFPRAWAVHELVRVNSRAEGNRMVYDDPESFHRKAHMLEPPPPIEPCPTPDRVALVDHEPSHLAITADMSCTGMVVVSDTFFPGWQAEVDRRPAKIYEVNSAMRGVVVPRGAHRITMRYRPMSVYLGAGLTLLGILAACGAAALGRATSVAR
jgi:hypothetical protein